MKLKQKLKQMAVLLSLGVLASCGGGGGGGGDTYGTYQSPYESASSFVAALNQVDGTYSSSIVLDQYSTLRSMTPGQDEWFVIWDAYYGQNKAFSLQYIRSVLYYAYYQNSFDLAVAIRNIESADIMAGNFNGDFFGNDYEVVDNLGTVYSGRNSGMLYADEDQTEDIGLELHKKEIDQIAVSVGKIAALYEVSVPAAMSIYSFGSTAKKLLKKGEVTLADQALAANEIEKLTNHSVDELAQSMLDADKKEAMLKDVAQNLGTSESVLRERILPDFFGMKL